MSQESAEIIQILSELEQQGQITTAESTHIKAALTQSASDSMPQNFIVEPEVSKQTVLQTSKDQLTVPAKVNPEDEVAKDLRAQLAEMSVPQKIKLAMFGNAVCRGVLILDPGKMIQQFVLKNPKLGINEIEAFAKNPNISDFVLRTLSESKNWMRNYSLKVSIVSNPKTPGDVALKWLRYLQEGDLRRVANSKNIPQLVATTAKKRLMEMK